MFKSRIISAFFALLLVSGHAGADGHEAAASKSAELANAEEEMQKTFGTLPT